MPICKGEAARAVVIGGGHIIPLLRAPLRNVGVGISLQEAVVDAVGVFVQSYE